MQIFKASYVVIRQGVGYGTRNKEMTFSVDKGVDDTSLMTKLTIDPETGAHGMRNNFVKLVKVG